MVLSLYKKKILVVGSMGMLGSDISRVNIENYDFLYTSLNPNNNCIKMDVTDVLSVKNIINNFKPDVIINCSAYTNVDNSEHNKQLCHNVNVHGLYNLMKYSNINTRIIHLSSDYVFDGTKAPYYEDSLTNPINYYGKTKLESENLLIGSNKKYTIIRPNVLFSSKGDNFFTFVYKSLKDNKKINIVNDQISNPTYIPDLTEIIFEIISLGIDGIYHIGSLDCLSRFDFALKIADKFNLDASLITERSSSEFYQNAKRPLNSTLNCDKVINMIDSQINTIDHSLNRMYNNEL